MPPSLTQRFSGLSALVLLMVIAIALSFLFFLPQSLRLDESQSLWQSGHSLSGILFIVAQDVHVPLYHFLLHGWQVLVGTGVNQVRLLSLFFFIASIPALYTLTRYAFRNERLALFSAFLFTISPFMNWYGNELRMYSLLTLLTIINQYFFLRLYRERGITKRGIWLGYLLTSILGIYTHYFFFLSLGAQAVFYLVHRREYVAGTLRRFLGVMVITLVTFIPWLWYVLSLGSASNSRPLIPAPSLITLFNTFSNFLFGFQTDRINSLLLSLWPLLMLFGFLALRRDKKIETEAGFFLYLLVLPILVTFLASYLIRPVYLSRYLILTLPALYILLAWLLARYQATTGAVVRNTLVGVMIITFIIQTVSAQTPVKEDYRQATAYLEANATVRDIIVVSAPFTVYPIEYYYRGNARITTLPIWDRSQVGPIPAFAAETLDADVKATIDKYQNIWVLLSYDQGYEEAVRLYFDTRYEKLQTVNFSPGMTLYEYRLRYDEADIESKTKAILTSLRAPLNQERILSTTGQR